jgi:hypothetical protein
MARHLWATDRLWEGVVGSSDDAWRAGLDVLAVTPLPAAQLGDERAMIAHRLRRLAEDARKTRGGGQLVERARDYGEILVTCAACHATQVDRNAL